MMVLKYSSINSHYACCVKSDPVTKTLAVGRKYIISNFGTTQKEGPSNLHVLEIHDATSDTFKYICMQAGKSGTVNC